MRSEDAKRSISVGAVVLMATAAGLISCGGPTNRLPPEKQALGTFAAQFQSNAPGADKSADPGRPLVIQTDPPPVTGLLGRVNAPIEGGIFTPTSAWAGWIDSTTYAVVYAGDSPDHPGRGLMFVVRRTGSDGHLDPDASLSTLLVSAPTPGGPLEIVRVEAGELVVVNPAGHESRFDPVTAVFDAPAP